MINPAIVLVYFLEYGKQNRQVHTRGAGGVGKLCTHNGREQVTGWSKANAYNVKCKIEIELQH